MTDAEVNAKIQAVANECARLAGLCNQLSTDNATLLAFKDGELDRLHPIGSIWISVASTDPGTLVGGTWAAFGAGRVMVGVDSTDSAFSTVEGIAGEKTHTLTVAEIPSHRHTDHMNSDALAAAGGDWPTNTNGLQSYTGYEGGGEAHNNLQPYINVYFFKRTA
jgi:microcystin-dependent protein